MKSKEINKLTPDEITSKINLLKKDLFNIRFKKINNAIDDTSKISKIKKDVARLMTKINKKK
jgi:large subunit ribosomal protein L29|tara:strand:+ start:630 stop:815 length:186 start_codon:yes stop_codon:yes gene_type:complete